VTTQLQFIIIIIIIIKNIIKPLILSSPNYHLEFQPSEQLNRGSFESKHNCLMLLPLFKLTTCFDLSTGPYSGHKICNRGDYTV